MTYPHCTGEPHCVRTRYQIWYGLLALLLVLPLWASQVVAETVNINKADTAAMQEHLPGIGPVKSQAIVDYRKKHGSFKSVDDLKNVPGIGDATLKGIRRNVSTTSGVTGASKGFKAKSPSRSSKSSPGKKTSAKDNSPSAASKSKSSNSKSSKSKKKSDKKSDTKSKSAEKSKDKKKKSSSSSKTKDKKPASTKSKSKDKKKKSSGGSSSSN